jgi:hypothetical protein
MSNLTAYERRWSKRRSLLNFGYVILFGIIAFWLGPIYFLWNVTPAPSQPSDYTELVLRHCEPIVRRMKEYERIHGSRPTDMSQFAPDLYAAEANNVSLTGGRFIYFVEYRQEIEYDFTPGNEHWKVTGPFVNGTIPVPPVQLKPLTKPTGSESNEPDKPPPISYAMPMLGRCPKCGKRFDYGRPGSEGNCICDSLIQPQPL